MNTNREIRWVAPLMIVLLVFILGASLIVKAVEVYGDSATKETPETAKSAPADEEADHIRRTSSEGDGAAAAKSMTKTSASHEITNQLVTAVGTPRIATDYISIKAAEHLEAQALKEQQQAEKERKLAAIQKQQKLEEQKALARLSAEEMKTTPPETIFFTRTELLTQADKDKSTWDYPVTDKELLMLQKIVMAEAEGEPYEGKVAVANVVLNRLRSANYPDTIKDVIYQKYQFSPVANGRMDRVTPNEDAIQAVNEAMHGRKEVPDDTLYFLSITLADDLTVHHSQEKVKTIGHHTFYK
ncbi:cell wall hydrolase [Paenibacillus sp. 453mf]|uniref:cell wall hydrolase n=1 Tax=Paenibacillus sp. 453mf TaxID=1761874 RepID=UPI0008EFDD26|nr:cell wall hydrolase [Paenibacillus sp. 453mf]SFS38693.1 N-acetylmuramoyl-L-alanine amidase [Paenibacillus sp. 453mf]